MWIRLEDAEFMDTFPLVVVAGWLRCVFWLSVGVSCVVL
jgi:hypothetical protein